MNLWPRTWRTNSRRCGWAILSTAGLLAGCQREEIRVYTAPKEKPVAAQPVTVRTPPMARPQLSWRLPTGWSEIGPGQMSLASFSIRGGVGQEAQVSITPLPLMTGRESLIVNMWREQVGLAPLKEEEVAQQFQSVEVGGEKGSLFEITGPSQKDGETAHIVTAMVHRNDSSWFYKLSGDAAVVAAQKPAFIEFLRSIQISQPPPPASGAATAVADNSPKPNWQAPSQWKPLPAGEMQAVKFAVPERDGAKAEVSVGIYDTDTGGMLANVNRWRGQIGLPPIDGTEMKKLVSALDPADSESKLVDMTNNKRRLVAAIVRRDGRYWFYKLLGDADAVAPEKEAFVAFVKSRP